MFPQPFLVSVSLYRGHASCAELGLRQICAPGRNWLSQEGDKVFSRYRIINLTMKVLGQVGGGDGLMVSGSHVKLKGYSFKTLTDTRHSDRLIKQSHIQKERLSEIV